MSKGIRYRGSAKLRFGAATVLITILAASTVPALFIDDGPPYEPGEALTKFEIADGYRVELFAAEPLVADPVAMEVDEYGRVYVVEDHGYPDDPAGAGTIRQLRDTDGDGLVDTSILFAENLSKPRGAIAWRGGLIVTGSPDLLFLRDNDGDGVADERKVLATGFSTTNPQLGVNTPIYGLDNWIYMAHLHPESRVIVGGDSVDVARRNFRFRPDTQEVEALSGRSQFGHTFDRFGRHLLTVNNNHIYQEMIAARYLERNPDLLLASVHESISDHGEAAEVFPITDDPDYELFTDVGVITSACGLTSYLGGAFGAPYDRATFVAEPVHNVVHADRLVPRGVALRAERIEQASEFLASTDRWFRPVNFYVGPDGALYVLDYYRDIIEQPKFIAQEKLDEGRHYAGSDRGRIYRIVPDAGLDPTWLDQLNLADATQTELIDMLADENIWWRRTAQRLLVGEGHVDAAVDLERLAVTGRTPEVRIHALYTLDGLGLLESPPVRRALRDPEPAVREHAVILAEARLDDVLLRDIIALSDDPDMRVRYQVLLTLGEIADSDVAAVRRSILLHDLDNHWIQAAALSAREFDPWDEAQSFAAAADDSASAALRSYVRRLAAMIARRGDHLDAAVQQSLDEDAPTWWRAAVLDGISEGIAEWLDADTSPELNRPDLLAQALRTDAPEVANAALSLLAVAGFPEGPNADELLRRQVGILMDSTESEPVRMRAISVIAGAELERLPFDLDDLMRPSVPASVQAEGIRLMAAGNGEIGRALLDRWNEMTPLVRAAASRAMAQDSARIALLLDEVEEGTLKPGAIAWDARQEMMLHSDPTLQSRARRLLPDRSRISPEVLAEYEAALETTGDPAEGGIVFDQVCAVCHQIQEERGVLFGPDLATIRSRRPEFILADILQPNREIVSGYEQWTIELHSGERLSGVIGEETPIAVTIRMPGGVARTISRRDIASMGAVGRSAMPPGLEAQISVDEMADLLAFLRRGGSVD